MNWSSAKSRFLAMGVIVAFILCALAGVAAIVTGAQPTNQWPTDQVVAQSDPGVATTTWEIDLTAAGFVPQTIRIQPGDTVRWTNRTNDVQTVHSGQPHRLYLPLVVGSASGETASPPRSAQASNEIEFEATLQPGQQFSYRFTVAGAYRFYAANTPYFSGEVIVSALESTTTPTATATDANTATPTESTTSTPTATETETATPAASATATDTSIATPTESVTSTPTATETATPTPVASATATDTSSATPTESATSTPTATETATPTATNTPTATSTPTETSTATSTQTPTATPTEAGPPLPPDPADVAPPLDQSVVTNLLDATSFLYTGDDPIQTGVVSGTLELRRAVVLRGRVLRPDGSGLPNVTVSVLGHSEFGQTRTRPDGMFDLAANGGGWLTVNYTKTGYLPAQRKVDAPWQDYAWLPDVMLIQEDPNVTLIDLTAEIPMQVARGSVISDSDGVRQETLFFPQGATAYLNFADGVTQTITTLHVRITEYTIGPNGEKMMPAELPPNSAYTYATEFSADEATAAGATDVWFNPPLVSYVENFLNFTVGVTVPMGHYDSNRGAWVAAESGRVIKIVSVTDGKVDLDIDGSGTPASPGALAALGVTDAERARLAEIYPVGQGLWRVPVPHFTRPWDKNQATSCEEPCPPPSPPDPCVEDECREDPPPPTPEDPTNVCGSIIGCETQTLGQVVEIVGAPFALHYQSYRTMGSQANYQLTIPLRGDSVSPKLRAIHLDIQIAGRHLHREFPPSQSSYTFVWDGKDAYGRRLQGKQPILIGLTYVYPLIYMTTERFGYNGSSAALAIATTRTSFDLTRTWRGEIGGWTALEQGLGGWTLNVHHAYDPKNQELYLGDGSRRSAESLNLNIIQNVAGSGASCFYPFECVDGITATLASMQMPLAVDVAPNGDIFITDASLRRVREVDVHGVITTVAGNINGLGCAPTTAPCGDGGPATQAMLVNPRNVALASDGSFYIADSQAYRIRKVDPNGVITTVAGTGAEGFSGDGGPALQARIGGVMDIAVAADGTIYFTETSYRRIRRIGVDGVISTVAGGGSGPPVTGMRATAVFLPFPDGIAWARDGSFYFTSYNTLGERFVYRIGVDGILQFVGGTTTGISPHKLAIGLDGALIMAEGFQHVRALQPDGQIKILAGDGVWCSPVPPPFPGCGDVGPARKARFGSVADVAVGPDGSIFVTDSQLRRIRQITPAWPAANYGDNLVASEDGGQVYAFDYTGRHLRTLDAFTGAPLYHFAYDGGGRLVGVTDGDGNVTTIVRSADGSPTAIVAPFGQTTALTVDASGYLATIVNPAGETLGFTYSAQGLMTQMQDARGFVHTFQYDGLGRLVRDDNPAAGFMTLQRVNGAQMYTVNLKTALARQTSYRVERISADALRRLTTYPSGVQEERVKYADGSLLHRLPDGTTLNTANTPDPRWGMMAPVAAMTNIATSGGLSAAMSMQRTATLSQVGNPFSLTALQETFTINGRTYTSNYDAATRTFTDISPAGRQQTMIIDSQARPTFVQAADLAPLSYTYDSQGRLIAATQGGVMDVRTATFSYNGDGYLASVTDPLGRAVTFAYDLAGRVTSQTLPDDGRVVSYAYDANGNLTSLTPPGRPAHTFTYTPVDSQASYTPPDIGIGNAATSYTYNLDRQLTRIARPDGKSIEVGYDFAGRPQSLTFSRGSIAYAYHPTTGNLAGVLAPGGVSLTLDYDGSLLTEQRWSGPVAGSVGYIYDNNFRRTSISVNGANAIAYSYDNDSLLTGVGGLTLSRNGQNGLLTGSALAGVTDAHGYNSFGEPISYTASFGGAPLLGFQYEYDKLGRIVTRTETISDAVNVYIYGYDLAGRLETVRMNGAPLSAYGYDANGNRLSYTGPGGPAAGSYDAQDRLLQYGVATYNYSANGELQTKTVGGQITNYTYDELGNLIHVVLPDGTQIDYLIDGLNRRIGKKVNGALTQGFLYDGQLRIVAELDGAGAVISRFVYATHVNVPDFMVKGGVTYRILTDHLGSPRLVVNAATGAVAQTMSFDEFGRVLGDTNPGFQPFGFAGGLYDRHTGLVRFGARDYDAEVGRWTAKDPIGFTTDEANLYVYSRNDPVNWYDPFGLAASVCVSDNYVLISLSIHYSGAGATPDTIRRFNKAIEQYWSGQFGKYKVKTKVWADPGGNTVTIEPGGGRSYVYMWLDSGTWYQNEPGWVAAHEAGHLMGLGDRYSDIRSFFKNRAVDPGWEGNVMGEHMGAVEERNIEEVIQKNKGSCSCTK